DRYGGFLVPLAQERCGPSSDRTCSRRARTSIVYEEANTANDSSGKSDKGRVGHTRQDCKRRGDFCRSGHLQWPYKVSWVYSKGVAMDAWEQRWCRSCG